jgi:hypothetical protein
MIEVITGLPGMGKTLTATRWAYYKGVLKGKTVYANYPLKGAIYYNDVFELLGNVNNALIVVDEMGIVFDQLRMYDVPDHTWMELRQHRKDGVNILGTAQSILDIAYPMRRLIQFEWNIYFKAWRFVAVTCRNPQPYGDRYGKYLWYLNKKIFSLYDTRHKVTEDISEDFRCEQEAVNSYNQFVEMQNDILYQSVVERRNT